LFLFAKPSAKNATTEHTEHTECKLITIHHVPLSIYHSSLATNHYFSHSSQFMLFSVYSVCSVVDRLSPLTLTPPHRGKNANLNHNTFSHHGIHEPHGKRNIL